jgi:hypothetical protein
MTLNSQRIICIVQSVLRVLHRWHHSEVYNIIAKLSVCPLRLSVCSGLYFWTQQRRGVLTFTVLKIIPHSPEILPLWPYNEICEPRHNIKMLYYTTQ